MEQIRASLATRPWNYGVQKDWEKVHCLGCSVSDVGVQGIRRTKNVEVPEPVHYTMRCYMCLQDSDAIFRKEAYSTLR